MWLFLAALIVAAATPETVATDINLAYMIPLSYAAYNTKEKCDAKNKPWAAGKCWSSSTLQKMAGCAAAAIKDFNDRNGAFVPEFANLGFCDKKFNATIVDTERSPLKSMKAVFDNAMGMDMILGAANSNICQATASLGGTS